MTRKSPRERKPKIIQPIDSNESDSASNFSGTTTTDDESAAESEVLDEVHVAKRPRIGPNVIHLEEDSEPDPIAEPQNASQPSIQIEGGQNSEIGVEVPVEGEESTKPKVKKPKPIKKPKVEMDDVHPRLKNFWDNARNDANTDFGSAEQPEDMTVNLLPFQREGLYWLKSQEQSSYHGGILADEMGLGKTVQTIALLVSQPSDKPNLILVPPIALMQWKSEISTKAIPGKFNIIVYHGNNRETSKQVLEDADIVLSTYSILEHSFRKEFYGTKQKGELVKKKSLIHSIHWGRIILVPFINRMKPMPSKIGTAQLRERHLH